MYGPEKHAYFCDTPASLRHAKGRWPQTASGYPILGLRRYGPWDRRYYHILSYLESKGLIGVIRVNNMFRLSLTDLGKSVAGAAEKSDPFDHLVEHMKRVKKLLGAKAGSTLKDLVYEVFGEEVAERQMGEVIE